jgi:hypothetical protein
VIANTQLSAASNGAARRVRQQSVPFRLGLLVGGRSTDPVLATPGYSDGVA